MDNFSCPFGSLFREYRTAKHISLWQIVHRMGYYLANIQRMEAGMQNPGVHLSFRYLHAIDADVGAFMAKLARRNLDALPQNSTFRTAPSVSLAHPALAEGQKSLFGPFLQQARLAAGMTRTEMARAAAYHLRNISSVERGKQDPGIMTALALVMSTGVDVEQFFSPLYAAWQARQESGSGPQTRPEK